MKHRTKKIIKAFCIVVGVWYIIVLLAIPKLSCGPVAALPFVVEAEMVSYAQSDLSYEQMGEIISSEDRWPGGSFYAPELTETTKGSWTLTALPQRKSRFGAPLWQMVLFLDFRRVGYPVLRISPGDAKAQRLSD